MDLEIKAEEYTSLEFSAIHMDWEKTKKCAEQLTSTKDIPLKNFILAGIYLGLRIGDLSKITYEQIISKSGKIVFRDEKKDGRIVIIVHPYLQAYFKEVYEKYTLIKPNHSILSRVGKKQAVTSRHFNTLIKKFAVTNELSPDASGNRISTHTMRKTFARKLYEKGNKTDDTLLAISTWFKHKDLATTRIYLGLVDEEIQKLIMSL